MLRRHLGAVADMKARSAKNKGSRYENALVELIREVDRDAHRTYGSGSGLDKNDIVCPNLNLEIEAKNHASWQMKSHLNQLERQRTPYNEAVLICRDPAFPETKTEMSVVSMRLPYFLELMKNKQGYVEVPEEDNREKKWAIQNAVSSLKKLLKQYE